MIYQNKPQRSGRSIPSNTNNPPQDPPPPPTPRDIPEPHKEIITVKQQTPKPKVTRKPRVTPKPTVTRTPKITSKVTTPKQPVPKPSWFARVAAFFKKLFWRRG